MIILSSIEQSSQSPLKGINLGCEDITTSFWQLWEKYRNYLYRCCLKWMNGNPVDAEDALSRAMIKAWEKVQNCTSVIGNFKAWLTRLAHNLCIDILRERNRGSRGVESFEQINAIDYEFVFEDQTPFRTLMQQELAEHVRCAINELPARLRETLILHLDEQQSYREIAEQLDISYDNVRKRISQARTILRKQLNEYVAEVDNIPRLSKPAKSRKIGLQKSVSVNFCK